MAVLDLGCVGYEGYGEGVYMGFYYGNLSFVSSPLYSMVPNKLKETFWI